MSSNNNYKILFNQLPWEKPAIGVEQKVIIKKNKTIRLVRFYYNFIEKHWCIRGHIGYVLDGEMTIDFNGQKQIYKKGDGLWIESGEEHKHKASIAKGAFVELLLFEYEN